MTVPNNGERLREAESFLTRRFGQGCTGVSLLGRGEWSTAYAFRLDGGNFVVRFGVFPEAFAKDAQSASFAVPALPIPRVLEMGEAREGHYAVSERVFGTLLDGIDEAGMRRVLPALLRALDAARLADLSGTVGCGPWEADGRGLWTSWRAWLVSVADDSPAQLTHGWSARLAASPTGNRPFAAAQRAMAALVPYCPEDRHLIHSDLLHENVLVAGECVTGVIDWGCALYGDFLYDLAWLSFWWPLFPAWQAIDIVGEARRHYSAIGVEVPDFAARLRCYELHIGPCGQAYSAFMGRWDDVEVTARRTLALAAAPLRSE